MPFTDSFRPTVLVVDDAPENITLLHAILAQEYKVKVANSGERALAIADTDTPPDLILLDVMMPGMDGLQTCRKLKANPALRDIPVILLTGKADVEDEEEGLEAGAADYIAKPISPAIVLQRVSTQLSLRKYFRAFEQMQAQLLAHQRDDEEHARAVAELEAAAAHDIRSGLSMINGYASLLRKKSLETGDTQATDYLSAMRDGSKRVAALATQWRETARDLRSPLRPALVEVKPLIEELLGDLKLSRADVPQVELGDLPPTWADAAALRLVWSQLLGNAWAALEKTAQPRLRIEGRWEGGQTLYTVTDNGPGLGDSGPVEKFPPFHRRADPDAAGGAGLGLFMALHAVRRHGGRLWAECMPGTETRFSFVLPAATLHQGAAS
jgi:CheY-like chemotaxis protein